jgi:MFS transporter, putative metabolite:H+ symporter
MNRNRLPLFASWQHMLAFWMGTLMVSIGVVAHVPMFWMGGVTHFRLAGMPMGRPMLIGMALIVLGIVAAGYGLRPGRLVSAHAAGSIAPPPERTADPRALDPDGHHRCGGDH